MPQKSPVNSVLNWDQFKQLNNIQLLLAFFVPSAFAFWGFRFLLPIAVNMGLPKILFWNIIASIMLFAFASVGLYLIKYEATENSISLRERLLIKKLDSKQWLICIAIMLTGFVLSVACKPLVELLRDLPGLSIPDYMPFWLDPTIDPMNSDMEIISPNYSLKNNNLILTIMPITLLLNILAEEIYFRAWLLPKMNSYGKWSWVFNGFLFALYHTFQLWLFPMILPVSLGSSLTAFISKSVLPAFIMHLTVNFLGGLFGIIILVHS